MTDILRLAEPLHGFWGALTAGGVWTAIVMLATVMVKNKVPMRRVQADIDAKLIDTLTARVDKLEAALEAARAYYEQKIDRLQAEAEAAQRIARHELANVKMRFRALVMLLKRVPNPPDQLAGILADIEAMEAEQTRSEAAEKGAVSGARIIAAGGAPAAPTA